MNYANKGATFDQEVLLTKEGVQVPRSRHHAIMLSRHRATMPSHATG